MNEEQCKERSAIVGLEDVLYKLSLDPGWEMYYIGELRYKLLSAMGMEVDED